MSEGKGFWHWAHEGMELILTVLGWEGLREVIHGWLKKTGEKAGDKSADWLTFQIFGVSSEDERRYNEARLAMDPADITRLNKKLAPLDPKMSDYYRIMVMNKDVEKTTQILTMHARMSDPDWAREIHIMNLDRTRDDSLFEKFKQFMKTDFPAFVELCYNAAKRVGGDAWKLLQPILNEIGRGAQATGREIARGACATGNGIAAGARGVGRAAVYVDGQANVAANSINNRINNPGWFGHLADRLFR
ncbi:hypothetical protein D4S03_11100 [bacterium]|nr:MAG: hypothetical protein D4S03_11100 [bacterium]